MDDTAVNVLLQYGALGAIALVFLGLGSWAFRVVLVRFLRAFDQLVDNLKTISTEHAVHAAATQAHHEVIVDKLDQLRDDDRTDGTGRRRKTTGRGA